MRFTESHIGYLGGSEEIENNNSMQTMYVMACIIILES